jgi:hypothetical protein
MNKDTQRNFGVGLTMFVAIVCLVSTLVLLSDLNKEGIVIAQSDSNASKFKAIRDQYLQSWEKLNFQSIFDTYVVGGSGTGYGVYEERASNTFAPGETLYLYTEPVGFTHSPSTDEGTKTLYTVDMSADITITTSDGTEVFSLKNLPVSKVISHQKNTELFLLVSLTQSEPFPKGDYKITYIIKDVPSGKTFDIVKEISIA